MKSPLFVLSGTLDHFIYNWIPFGLEFLFVEFSRSFFVILLLVEIIWTVAEGYLRKIENMGLQEFVKDEKLLQLMRTVLRYVSYFSYLMFFVSNFYWVHFIENKIYK